MIVANLVVVGTIVAIGVVSYQRAAQVERADEVGAAFQAELDAFETEVYQELQRHRRLRDAEAILATVDGLDARRPQLREVSDHGAASSVGYQDARARAEAFGEGFEDIRAAAEETLVAAPFLEAAEELLRENPLTLIDEPSLPDGSRLRDEVVPAYRAAIERFDGVEVPAAAAEAAEAVRAAPVSMIARVEALAADLDAGRGGSVGTGEEHRDALEALNAYERDLDQRLDAAIAQILGSATEDG